MLKRVLLCYASPESKFTFISAALYLLLLLLGNQNVAGNHRNFY